MNEAYDSTKDWGILDRLFRQQSFHRWYALLPSSLLETCHTKNTYSPWAKIGQFSSNLYEGGQCLLKDNVLLHSRWLTSHHQLVFFLLWMFWWTNYSNYQSQGRELKYHIHIMNNRRAATLQDTAILLITNWSISKISGI